MGSLPWRFSDAEFARRRRQLEDLAQEAGVGAVLLWGSQRSGPAVAWLTGWPVTAEAHALAIPGEPVLLAVSYVNHLPNATRLAHGAEVVAGGADAVERMACALDRRGIGRVGIVGGLPWTQARRLGREELVDLNQGWSRVRWVKSGEEIDALRAAAAVTDAAMSVLLNGHLVGASEHELQARVQGAYLRAGALHQVSYLSVTSPASPDRCVPSQWPADRRVAAGDVLSWELSAASAPDLAGQLLRTFVAGTEATSIVVELHEAAQRCFEAVVALVRPGTTAAELVAATSVVEEAGFTTVDDVVHGYGGGYLPPVLSSSSRVPRAPVPDLRLRAGMAVSCSPT